MPAAAAWPPRILPANVREILRRRQDSRSAPARRLLRGLLVPALVALLFLPNARAEEKAPEIPGELREKPIFFSSDEVIYDEELGVVTASGNVEITQDGRTLLADTVSYNQRSGVVTAAGNVSLIEEDGTVFFAEYVELSDDLRNGFINDVGVLMTDKSRIAAASGTRRDGKVTTFNKAVFSACELCREDPTRPPLWQLKADEVVHDQEAHTITYRNARMEFFGIPVAYTPYFKHPDPTVDRQSGFLAPTFGSSDSLGLTLQVPYYWDISPDRDATFEPIITTKQSVVLAGQYRELFKNGMYEFNGSATVADREKNGQTESNQFRGHVDTIGRFEINEDWRWGFDAERASDDTYLRLYNFSDDSWLTSNLYTEYLSGRNFAGLDGYMFQGLREDIHNEELPIILPLMNYNYLGEPDSIGGRTSIDANLGVLTRREGRDTRRISLITGWEMPFFGPIGDVYRLRASLETDGYWVNDFDPDDSDNVNPPGPSESEFAGRILPQLALQWRYPLVRPASWGDQIVEPIVQLVAGTDTANNHDIPNEDSLDFEFSDANLFSLNRFPGVDRVDPGSRVDYGLKWAITGPTIGQINAFLGQSYRFETDDAFGSGSGLEDNLSDIVGRVRLTPQEDIDISYRFRFNKDNFDSERQEIDLSVGPPALNLDLSYIFLANDTTTQEFDTREELVFAIGAQLNENWSIFGGHRRDLEANDALSTAIGLSYQDECFFISAEGKRTFYEDREIEPEDSFMVRVVFKHLGQVSTQ